MNCTDAKRSFASADIIVPGSDTRQKIVAAKTYRIELPYSLPMKPMR
jgi:hypothetical protein